MKTANGSIISRSFLVAFPQYWLFIDGKYIYCEGSIHNPALLPIIDIEYESILKEHGILYRRISNTLLEFWDEKCYEEVDITLPTFIPWEDGYRQVKCHTESIITEETQEKAATLNYEVVLPAVSEMQRKKKAEEFKLFQKQKQEYEASQRKKLANILANAMGDDSTVVFEDGSLSYNDFIPSEGICLNADGIDIKVFNVCLLSNIWCNEFYTPYIIAFDMGKLPSSGYLELQVPKGEAGMFIGREGWQVKKWAKSLGLKYIYVTEKEE